MIYVEKITVNKTNIKLNPGEDYAGLSAVVSPDNATCKTVKWESLNTSVVVVNEMSGFLHARNIGQTSVVARAIDGSGVTKRISVTVARQPVEDITLGCSSVSLEVGALMELIAYVSPSNSYNKGINWTSANTGIATVDDNGMVRAISPGSTTITATAADGSGVYDCCEVTCNTPDTDSIPEHSHTSSHIYHATLSEDGDEYTFTCAFSQCDDSFTVPKDQVVGSYVTSNTDLHLGNSQTPLAYGIDVSYHQGEISQNQWNEIANTQIDGHTITFAILRIGIDLIDEKKEEASNRQKDEQFENNYARAKAAGLHVGCYYYTKSVSTQNAVADAEQVIEWIGNKQFEYPVFFDIEAPRIKNEVADNATRTRICLAFMDKMREAGFFTGLYTNNAWITESLNASMLFPEYDVWYARYYDHTPNDWQSNWAGTGRKFGMWQYTESKKIAPISGNVDCNVAYKNYPLIIKSLHLNNF